MLIQLKPKHRPTAMYENQIRRMLPVNFPQVVGYFQAADIVSQVLNFGLPAMIDVQISGIRPDTPTMPLPRSSRTS